jgi:hypothetical protein
MMELPQIWPTRGNLLLFRKRLGVCDGLRQEVSVEGVVGWFGDVEAGSGAFPLWAEFTTVVAAR